MLAALGFEDPVCVVALHGERRRLDSVLLPWARLEDLGLEAAIGRPAQVHAQQDLGPVLRVRAARVGLDRDGGVAGVVLAGEERVLLEALELAAERDDARLDVVGETLVELEQLLRVLVLVREPVVSLEAFRDARVLGADGGSALLVVPESRLPELCFELNLLFPQPIRVKGNHGPSPAGPRFLRAAPEARVVPVRPCGGGWYRVRFGGLPAIELHVVLVVTVP